MGLRAYEYVHRLTSGPHVCRVWCKAADGFRQQDELSKQITLLQAIAKEHGGDTQANLAEALTKPDFVDTVEVTPMTLAPSYIIYKDWPNGGSTPRELSDAIRDAVAKGSPR